MFIALEHVKSKLAPGWHHNITNAKTLITNAGEDLVDEVNDQITRKCFKMAASITDDEDEEEDD